jgi:predicted RNA-binding protein with EMAP domain
MELDRFYYNIKRSNKMAVGDNKELIEALTRIEKKLGDIQYNLIEIKNAMPRVPYYGDLLQDIAKAVENIPK